MRALQGPHSDCRSKTDYRKLCNVLQNHLNLTHSTVDALYFGMQLSDILLGAVFSCGVQRRLRGVCHMVLISTASVDRTSLACLHKSCICVLKGVKRYQRLDKDVRTLLADEEGMLRVYSSGAKHGERCCEGANSVLTVSLCTDEAGGGAIKEGEKASHG